MHTAVSSLIALQSIRILLPIITTKTYAVAHSLERGRTLSGSERYSARVTSVRPVAKYLSEHLVDGNAVLEIGAGAGELLSQLTSTRRRVAFEFNEEFVRFMTEDLGLEAYSSDFLVWDDSDAFNLAVIVNTLDHIFQPPQYLAKLRRLLAPQGFLYIEVPNDEQALRVNLPHAQGKQFSNFMYHNAHYYSFTKDTLVQLVTEQGFDVVDVTFRHDYSLVNFLHWYFRGQPQDTSESAMHQRTLSLEPSKCRDEDFLFVMGEIFEVADASFRTAMANAERAETICLLAQRT